jgi:hypothetical protein
MFVPGSYIISSRAKIGLMLNCPISHVVTNCDVEALASGGIHKDGIKYDKFTNIHLL